MAISVSIARLNEGFNMSVDKRTLIGVAGIVIIEALAIGAMYKVTMVALKMN